MADRLSEIKAREQAATAGHWGTYYDSKGTYTIQARPRLIPWEGNTDDGAIATVSGEHGDGQTYHDARFVAHARDDVRWLLEQLEQARRIAVELENENARLTAELQAARDAYEGMAETANCIESQAIRQHAHLTARVEKLEADNAALTERLLALQNANEGAYKAAYDATGGPHFDTAQPFGATA